MMRPAARLLLHEGRAHVVVALDDVGLLAHALARFDEVGVEGALGEEASSMPRRGHLALLDGHEEVADDLALVLGIVDARERAEEFRLPRRCWWRCLAPRAAEDPHDLLGLALRMRPVSTYRRWTWAGSEGLEEEGAGHGGVDAARDEEEHRACCRRARARRRTRSST